MANLPTRGSGASLSPEDRAVLDHWSYDADGNRLSTDASVRASLNSFELGEMHTVHSGGENVFWQNNVSNTNWFPVWQGVKPFVDVDTHMGVSPTTRRLVNDPHLLLTNGASSTASNVAYEAVVTLQDNESTFKVEVEAGEAYTGDLTYTLREGTQAGLLKFKQVIAVDVAIGDPITLQFSHPSEAVSGSDIAVNMVKDDGNNFLVKSGTNVAMPWIRLTLNNFEDVPIVGGAKRVTSDFDLHYSGDYEVDTSAAGVTITVPPDVNVSFAVSDAAQTFNPTRPCVVDFSAYGQGSATLQTSRDAYKFYYDNGTWYFKDLDTKNGGSV